MKTSHIQLKESKVYTI